MPSLRKRVSSYFRQLSFYNDPKERGSGSKHNINENAFVTKYLRGDIVLRDGPRILHGKSPADLPNYDLAPYQIEHDSVVGCYSGPNGGLTSVKRQEKHLSVGDDIDFIDIQQDEQSIATATISVANIDCAPKNNLNDDDDPYLHKSWNRKTENVYGISDSLYDLNQVTKIRNGDPIADCFGIIARCDSAILAVADGVNWGEKASVAAKSAIHGGLHYLNKTIFNDTKCFDDLLPADAAAQKSPSIFGQHRITNTREVFVCLLRAFNCAHDLILENEGMLTTLTVAVVLPLLNQRSGKSSQQYDSYVCCVCNVGDTLAYVYSHKYGVRELTKGSHDVNCNRDMRDALGALGPVDGINPELSNLTLSQTVVQRGDIILVASDGLTDNFDPNVCKFTVNASDSAATKSVKISNVTGKMTATDKKGSMERGNSVTVTTKSNQPPVKPPRKSKDPNVNRETAANVRVFGPKNDVLKGDLHNTKSNSETQAATTTSLDETSCKTVPKNKSPEDEINDNPLIVQFVRENSLNDTSTNFDKSKETISITSKPKTIKPSTATTTFQQPTKKTSVLDNKQTKETETKRQTSRGESYESIKKTTPATKSQTVTSNFLMMRSKTSVDMRRLPNKAATVAIQRNEDGIPFVSPVQRYELSLLLMEDVLKHGISGHDLQCTTARRACENLVNFTRSISAAKRRTLEDPDLYYNNMDGLMVEVSQQEKKIRRRKGLERVQNLPGKLDHVSIVAYNVGNFASIF